MTRFHPVLVLPPGYVVADFSGPQPAVPETPWVVGRYDELRPALYTQAIFAGSGGAGRRCLHIGVDLGGPAGTAVHAFAEGRILHLGPRPAPGDYGHVIITEHQVDGAPLYALHGHLSATSLAGRAPGDAVARGEVIGWLGTPEENGGWPPHLHFQLALDRPETWDMPGVVDPALREQVLARYPDPRRVLGPIYPI